MTRFSRPLLALLAASLLALTAAPALETRAQSGSGAPLAAPFRGPEARWRDGVAYYGAAQALSDAKNFSAARRVMQLALEEFLAVRGHPDLVRHPEIKERIELLTLAAHSVIGFYAVFERDFDTALAFAEVAVRNKVPGEIWFEMNYAHALMFTEQQTEAYEIYTRYRDEPITRVNDDLTWRGELANDFAKFREAGLDHPLMEQVERELGITP